MCRIFIIAKQFYIAMFSCLLFAFIISAVWAYGYSQNLGS